MITYRQLGRNGQLGNQLWQIASTAGIAHREGDVAGFPFWRYRRYFSVPEAMFPDLSSIPSRDLGLDYLQNVENFKGIEGAIRAYFSPAPRHLGAPRLPFRRPPLAPPQDVASRASRRLPRS